MSEQGDAIRAEIKAYRDERDTPAPDDRHEGPTPRDCPECLRIHDGEDMP